MHGRFLDPILADGIEMSGVTFLAGETSLFLEAISFA